MSTIPAADLPLKTPGSLDTVVGVDEATGNAKRFPKDSLGDNTIRPDLASTTPGKGAELVGFKQSGAGTVARTMQEKGRERVSVLDFIPPSEHAAIRAGTSTMDVAGYFNATIVAAVAQGRASVYIPAGQYTIGSTVTINDRIRLHGDGDYSRLKPTITSGAPCVDVATNTNYVCLENFRVDSGVDFAQFTSGAVNGQNCTGIRFRSTGGTFSARYALKNMHVRGCKVGYDMQGFIGSMENVWATVNETGLIGVQFNSIRLNYRSESNRKAFQISASNGIHFDQFIDEGAGSQSGLVPATLDGCYGIQLSAPYFEWPDRQNSIMQIGATTKCGAVTISGLTIGSSPTTGASFEAVPIAVDKCDGLTLSGYFSTGSAHNCYSTTANTKGIIDLCVYASGEQWAQDASTNLSQVRNHFPNPNFDLWFRGWPNVSFVGCTGSQETTIVRRGKNALRLTATAGATNSRVSFVLNDGLLAAHLRSKKSTIYAWVWVPNDAVFDPAALGAQPFKVATNLLSNNGATSTNATSGSHHTTRGAWNLLRVSHTMQSDSTRVDVEVYLNQSGVAAAGTEYIVIDSIFLVEGDGGQDIQVRNGWVVDSDLNTARGLGGKLVQMVTALPTDVDMTYEVGDTFHKSAPAAGASPGWVCTTAGTGATAVFKAMANLAA